MKIFVGNLSFQSTDESIRSAFGAHGQVDEVAIITDRETGRPRGFCFVTMPNDNEAQAAIESLDGSSIDGRNINVSQARERGAGGGGGGGGRGGGGGGGRW